MPYMWGTIGILYNTTMVDEPVDSWDILWDPKYAKQIIMLDSQREAIGVALIRLGYSINSTDVNQLNEAAELLKEQKPLVLAYALDETKDKMVAGEAALCVGVVRGSTVRDGREPRSRLRYSAGRHQSVV